jgi:uncharacterized protein YceK
MKGTVLFCLGLVLSGCSSLHQPIDSGASGTPASQKARSKDATTVNTGILGVDAVKANWSSDESNVIYRYNFTGDFGNAVPSACRSSNYTIASPDPNINNLLQLANLLGVGFLAHIDPQCNLSTVEISNTPYSSN